MNDKNSVKERVRTRLSELGCTEQGLIFPIADILVEELYREIEPANLVSADAQNRLRTGTDGKFFVP
jgi:hypothetical protein